MADMQVEVRRSDQQERMVPPTKSRRGVHTAAVYVTLALGLTGLILGAVAIARTSTTSSASAGSPTSTFMYNNLRVIQDVKKLSPSAKDQIVRTMLHMKRVRSEYDPSFNAYDYFVSLHLNATLPSTQIHAGFYFYPWHREMVNRFNKELARVSKMIGGDDSLWFPYWDWTNAESTAAMLELSYLGGQGSFSDGYLVKEGNFAHGNWALDPKISALPLEKSSGGMLRAKGNGLQMCFDSQNASYVLDTPYNPPHVDTLGLVGPFARLPDDEAPINPAVQLYLRPTIATRNAACPWGDLSCVRQYYDPTNSTTVLNCKHFSVQLPVQADQDRCLSHQLNYTFTDVGLKDPSNPWATTKDYYAPNAAYFRACFEGIDPAEPIAKGLERVGASLHPPHGATHTYMGGTLATPASPNDPIFTHLHTNVDRLYAEYQNRYGNKWFEDGPGKQYLHKPMPIFKNPTVTIAQALSYNSSYKYTYDTFINV